MKCRHCNSTNIKRHSIVMTESPMTHNRFDKTGMRSHNIQIKAVIPNADVWCDDCGAQLYGNLTNLCLICGVDTGDNNYLCGMCLEQEIKKHTL